MFTLKQRYSEYKDRLRASGVKLVSFDCPCCSEIIDTKPAPKGETWDTMATCPHCEGMYKLFTEGGHAYGLVPPAMSA